MDILQHEFYYLPRIPKEPGTVLTFMDISPKKFRSEGSPGEYHIKLKVNDDHLGMYRTSDRYLMNEIDRLCKELGTLFHVEVVFVSKQFPLTVLDNPNIKMFQEVN